MSSKEKNRIVWIDDDPNRYDDYKDCIENECKASVKCVDIKSHDTSTEIHSLLKNDEQPDLILIDHVLDHANHNNTKSEPQIRLGVTWASIIREHWPSCPIIGVTAAKTFGNDDFDQEVFETYQYDMVISIDELTDNTMFLCSIMNGFAELHGITSTKDLLRIFGLTEDDPNDNEAWEFIKRSLPESVSEYPCKPQYASRFFHWFNKEFHALPGFLYDDIWVATFLGVKKESFKKHSSKVSTAKYGGSFQNDQKPRWWRHKIQEQVYKHGEGMQSSQEIASTLFSIPEEDRSECSYSKKEWPDYVAFSDDSELTKQLQVFRRYTRAHAKRRFLPFYEEPRVLEGNDE